MTKPITVQQFFQTFPDDDACLEHLMAKRFGTISVCPKCEKATKFHRLSTMPAYSCQHCGHHIHPMVGTPFEKSRTSLQSWYYAMYLFSASRHGVSAKELQRQLGVTYKTAWRMGHEIRKYLNQIDGTTPLDGDVEVDETYIGGKRAGKRGRGAGGKSIVVGMQDRDGDLRSTIVPDVKRVTLHGEITANVTKGSTVHTDEWQAYRGIDKHGYTHKTVEHSANEFARDGSHVNHVEGFFGMIKRSIRSTHINVSRKHLSKYLGEFEYRWNLRKQPEQMFPAMMDFPRKA
jgi:transposase